MTSPIDDAHAAAPHLAEQLVTLRNNRLENFAAGQNGRWRGVRLELAAANRCLHLVHTLLIGEKLLQLSSVLGIGSDEGLRIRALAGVDVTKVLRQDLFQVAGVRHRFRGWDIRAWLFCWWEFRHAQRSSKGAMRLRSSWRARNRSPATAFSLFLRPAAISRIRL